MHSHTHWHTLDTHEGFPPWVNPKHKGNRNLTSPLSYSPWDTVTQHPWAPPSHLNSRNHHCEGRHTLLLLLFFQKWAKVKKQPDREKNSTSRFTVQIYTRCQWGVNNHMNLRFYIQNLSTFSTQGQKEKGLLQGLTNFNWDQLSPTSTWTKTWSQTNWHMSDNLKSVLEMSSTCRTFWKLSLKSDILKMSATCQRTIQNIN
jgi:hypothetical protein